MENKKLIDYSEIELKAIKSDIYEELDRLQKNLIMINNELNNRKETKTEKEN